MRVYELLKYLHECDSNAIVFTGKPLDQENNTEVVNVLETRISNVVGPTVYLYGEER